MMRIGMLVSGVAFAATLGVTLPAYAGGDYHDDTSIEEVSHYGVISERDDDTAYVKVEYTCPDDARGLIAVALSQEDDNYGGYRRGYDETEGHGKTYVHCTGDDEWVWVRVEADHHDEWERGQADARVLLLSKSYHDNGGYRDNVDKDFAHESIYLVTHH